MTTIEVSFQATTSCPYATCFEANSCETGITWRWTVQFNTMTWQEFPMLVLYTPAWSKNYLFWSYTLPFEASHRLVYGSYFNWKDYPVNRLPCRWGLSFNASIELPVTFNNVVTGPHPDGWRNGLIHLPNHGVRSRKGCILIVRRMLAH